MTFCRKHAPRSGGNRRLFNSDEGCLELARSCSARRLIRVAMLPGEQYASKEAIIDEVSPHVTQLTPHVVLQAGEKVECVTLQEDLGVRRVIAEYTS